MIVYSAVEQILSALNRDHCVEPLVRGSAEPIIGIRVWRKYVLFNGKSLEAKKRDYEQYFSHIRVSQEIRQIT